MEWRLGESAIEDKEEAGLCRKCLDVERDGEWGKGVGCTPRKCNGSSELKEKEKEYKRDKDKIVREYYEMLLEREGFDRNKLRS